MGLYHYNPCKVGRHPLLVTIGDALAAFFIDWFEEPTEGCPCCMAIRILTLTGIAAGVGFLIGRALA